MGYLKAAVEELAATYLRDLGDKDEAGDVVKDGVGPSRARLNYDSSSEDGSVAEDEGGN